MIPCRCLDPVCFAEHHARGRLEPNGEIHGYAARRLADVWAQSVTLQDPPPGVCYWPVADPEPPAAADGCWSDGELAEFQREWNRAMCASQRPVRLWLARRVLAIGTWLVKHGCERATVILWRVTGYWKA